MKELGKIYVTHIYKDAGHGFPRAQEERAGANLEASRQARPATIEFLRKYLDRGDISNILRSTLSP